MTCKYIKNEKLRPGLLVSTAAGGGQSVQHDVDLFADPLSGAGVGGAFAMGGTGAIVEGLGKLMVRRGFEIRLGEEVTAIEIGQDHESIAQGHQLANPFQIPLSAQ